MNRLKTNTNFIHKRIIVNHNNYKNYFDFHIGGAYMRIENTFSIPNKEYDFLCDVAQELN